MTDLASSILAIKSDAQVSINAEDIDQITWHDGNPTNISNEEILAKQVELKAEHSALSYSRNRRDAYPDWQTQLEKIADDGIDKWKSEMVDPVKAKFPKP